MDAVSFFVFSEVWGALLLLAVWLGSHLFGGEPRIVALSISVPFALCMFGAMWSRLEHLRWPKWLLVPVCVTYVWIFCDNVLFIHRWPIEIPGSAVSVLGIYSGAFWLLISIIDGRDKGDSLL